MSNSCSAHFDKYLLPVIILPTIKEIDNSVDKDFKRAVSFYNYIDDGSYFKQLSKCYEEKREWLKNAYFGDNLVDDSLLDMHKIAAILCRSILRYKPFAFDISKANDYKNELEKKLKSETQKNDEQIQNELLEWTVNNYWVNYKVAIDIALNVTFFDLINRLGTIETKYPEKNVYGIDIDDMLCYLNKNGIDTYKSGTTPIPLSHESFYWSLIINLAINDTNKRDFDYLGMATTFFQIQQYSVLLHHYNRKNQSVS